VAADDRVVQAAARLRHADDEDEIEEELERGRGSMRLVSIASRQWT
jgi:hypothetical protein